MRLAIGLAVLTLAAAAPTAPPAGKAANDGVEIEARVYADKAAVRELIGDELEAICVVDLRIVPRGDKPLKIDPDDFTLRSDRDGQRSQPFAPSQIAGDARLVVSSGSQGGGAYMGNESGPVWGGIGGGRPRRLPGGGGSVGNVSEETVQAAVDTSEKSKDNPLLAKLKRKVLPAREGTEPLTGLLYFSLEGKHKPKDLELVYRGPAGKLSIRFK
ncbi:MAG: hypothetical protein HY822_01895 [Acidobacteria bacterium]|nr:hypothetical protein [Acidobacteriota bacterium]